MKTRKLFISLTALLLAVSMLLSLGIGASAVEPEAIASTQVEGKPTTKAAVDTTAEGLYFGFGNTAADQTRYSDSAYGATNFDDLTNWATPNFSSASVSSGLFTATSTSSIPYLRAAVNKYMSNDSYVLNYTIQEDDVFEMRYRISDSSASSVYLSIYIGIENDDGTVTVSEANKVAGKYNITDGAFATATMSLSAFAGKKIRTTQLTFRDVSDGHIAIDYAYFGPAAKTPVEVSYYEGDTELYREYVGYGMGGTYQLAGSVTNDALTYYNGWQDDSGDYYSSLADATFTADTKLTSKKDTLDPNEIVSNKYLSTGEDSLDDQFSVILDAYSYGKPTTLKSATPLDITLVLDRSASMSAPADPANILSTQYYTLDQIIAKMDTVRLAMGDDFYDGYFRATSWLRTTKTTAPYASNVNYPHDGWASWEAIRFYDPDGDGQGEWQTWVVNVPSSYHWSDLAFGIIPWESSRNKMHYGSWMELHEAKEFHDARRNSKLGSAASTGYYYSVTVPRLTTVINSISDFIDEVNASSACLPDGTHHTVSILSYGGAVMDNRFKYYIDSSFGYMNFVDQGVSITSKELDTNYDEIMTTLRQHYVYGSTMTQWALEVVSNTKTSTDSYVATSATDYGYLVPKQEGRHRAVILLTDGQPTAKTGVDFSASYADGAILAANSIKATGAHVYTIGLMPELDPSAKPIPYSYSQSDVTKTNTFLTLVSSNYPTAKTMQSSSFGYRAEGNYYLVDKGNGLALASQFQTLLEEITTSTSTLTAPLALREELTREFKPDADRAASVFIAPYLGNGVFGERVLIGQHNLNNLDSQGAVGVGYTLSYDTGKNAMTLVWTDAMYGYLREVDVKNSKSCYPQYLKGYKVFVELPIVVDRENAVGGDNIATSLPSSGLYYVDENLNIITEQPARDENGNPITDDDGNPVMVSAAIVTYDIPYVNVQTHGPIYDGELKFSHSLTLENDISINFIGQGSALNAYETFYLECKVPVYEGNTFVGYEIVNIAPVFNGTNYEFTLTGVTAKMMNDDIEAVFRLTKDGQEYYSKTDVYSVAEYAYGKLESIKPADSDTLKAICANLLRYGAMAQTQFNYRTNALADAEMTEAHKAFLTDLDTIEMNSYMNQLNDHDAPVVPWKSATLELGNKVIMCLIANLSNYTGDPAELTMRLTYTDAKGETVSVERPLALYNEESKLYAVSYDALRATEMRTILSAAIYKNGTRVSKTVEYSIESYGARNSEFGLQELCRAMLAYGDCASAFFAN